MSESKCNFDGSSMLFDLLQDSELMEKTHENNNHQNKSSRFRKNEKMHNEAMTAQNSSF